MAQPAASRQLHWWESGEVAEHLEASPGDDLDKAIDLLSLAWTAQHSSHGDASVTGLLEQWCLELRDARTSLATAMTLQDVLDRLPRDRCEPQCWAALNAAEAALTRHILRLRLGG